MCEFIKPDGKKCGSRSKGPCRHHAAALLEQAKKEEVNSEYVPTNIATTESETEMTPQPNMQSEYTMSPKDQDQSQLNICPSSKPIQMIKFDLDDNPNGWSIPANFDIIKHLHKDGGYIKYDAKLITLIHNNWFQLSDNMFKLVGFFRRKPHVSSQWSLQTYLVILQFKTGSEMFNLARAAADWNAWTGKSWVSKFGVREIKQIAGGYNSEGYSKWKAEFEPEIPKEKKESKSKTESPITLEPPTSTSELPAIFDSNNKSCYGDSIELSTRSRMTSSQVSEFIHGNIAYILNGGNSFFMTKGFDANGNIDYTRISTDNMKKTLVRFCIPDDEGEYKQVPMFKCIDKMIPHISYVNIDFIPYAVPDVSQFKSKSVFNTFAGMIHKYNSEFTIDHNKIHRFLDHIKQIWCSGDEALYECTIKTFALYVQRPERKTKICLVITGREGLGKNIITDILRDHVIGKRYVCETPSMAKITGKFNAFVENKLLCVLNEAANVSSDGAHEAQEVLKDRIDAETIPIERKNIDPYTASDRCNYICYSNNNYVIKASTELRRYVFYQASDAKLGDSEYFRSLADDFNEHGAGIHLYHYLMSLDVSGFVPQRDFPTTTLKEQMKMDAFDKPTQWLIACCNEEVMNFMSIDNGNFNSVSDMLSRFNQWMISMGDKSSWTTQRFGRSIVKLLGEGERPRQKGIRMRGYTLSIDSLKEQLIKYTRRADLFNAEEC